MIFLTFQPKGYENMKRYSDWHDTYYGQLGYDPIYCICAESLLSTVIGTVFAYPVIPEQAIFFKCKNYYCINKINHILHIGKDKLDVESYVISRSFLREQIKKDYDVFNDVQFFGESEDIVGRHEFLINPADMQIIDIVDIKQTVCDALVNASIGLESVYKYEQEMIDDTRDNYIPKKFWHSVEMSIRSNVARLWWGWYAIENDCLIEDYKRIVGCKLWDCDISMERCPVQRIWDLYDSYNENPCKQTFNELRDYIMKQAVKNDDD